MLSRDTTVFLLITLCHRNSNFVIVVEMQLATFDTFCSCIFWEKSIKILICRKYLFWYLKNRVFSNMVKFPWQPHLMIHKAMNYSKRFCFRNNKEVDIKIKWKRWLRFHRNACKRIFELDHQIRCRYQLCHWSFSFLIRDQNAEMLYNSFV